MTDLFSFVLVMVSLVLAIGVTHLVQGVTEILRVQGGIRRDPLPLIWAGSLFLVAAIYWWSLWDLRNVHWRFHHFFYMLLAPTLLHVAASLLVSTKPVDAGGFQKGSQFDRVRLPFMIVMALFSIVGTLKGLVVGAEPLWTAYRPIQLWGIALYVTGALLPGAVSQRIIAALVFISYVASGFFFRLIPGAFGS
ncbi:MAG: hypothetical protein ABIT38_22880 [Gemmatimonadaceae bacterium]